MRPTSVWINIEVTVDDRRHQRADDKRNADSDTDTHRHPR